MVQAQKKDHFKKWKASEMAALEKMITEAKMLAIANLSNLPAGAALDFRTILKKSGFKVRVSKVRLVRKMLEKAGYKDLSSKYVSGSVALITGTENPFNLYSLIKKNASTSGAKAGMIAPDDIIVSKGDTGIPPGPALSDFKAVKINTKIQDGKIFVPKDYTVAKKGDLIDAKVATILTKLNIKPIKIVLGIKGAYEVDDKILYDVDTLNIDLEAVKNDVMGAFQNSYYLSMGIVYPTKENIKPLITKAFNNTKALAVSQNIVNKVTVKSIVGKAHRQASGVKSKVN